MAAAALEMLGSDTEPLAACSISDTAVDTGAVEKVAEEALPRATEEDSDIIRGGKHSFRTRRWLLNSNPLGSVVRGKLEHEVWLLDETQGPSLWIPSLEGSRIPG